MKKLKQQSSKPTYSVDDLMLKYSNIYEVKATKFDLFIEHLDQKVASKGLKEIKYFIRHNLPKSLSKLEQARLNNKIKYLKMKGIINLKYQIPTGKK